MIKRWVGQCPLFWLGYGHWGCGLKLKRETLSRWSETQDDSGLTLHLLPKLICPCIQAQPICHNHPFHFLIPCNTSENWESPWRWSEPIYPLLDSPLCILATACILSITRNSLPLSFQMGSSKLRATGKATE